MESTRTSSLKRALLNFFEGKFKNEGVVFFGFLLLISLLIYQDFLFQGPKFFHSWAQTDRFCVALQYVQNGLNFFTPQVCNLGNNDGTTGMEFPILFYFSAIFMKVFSPESPFFVRAFSLLSSLTGLSFLYMIFRRFNVGIPLSFLGISIIFGSTIFLYYQANFNPNHFALGLCLVSIYFFFRFKDSVRLVDFYAFNILGTVAALSKTTFAVYFLAIHLFLVYYHWSNPKLLRIQILFFLISVGLLVSHFLYNRHLNTVYQANFFTNKPEMFESPAQAYDLTIRGFRHWCIDLLLPSSYAVIALVSAYCLAFFRFRVRPNTLIFGTLVLGGCFCAYYLMGKQYLIHDYYYIDVFYIPLGLFLVKLFSELEARFPNKLILGMIALGLAIITINQGHIWFHKRLNLYLPDRGDLITHDFEGSFEVLDRLGIPKGERIVVFDPYSPNAIFFYTKRRGYTTLSLDLPDFDRWKRMGLKYIVAEQISITNYKELIKLRSDRMKLDFGNEHFSVFKIL